MRLHSLSVSLPFAPGGILGIAIGEPLFATLGFTGATLALLVAAGVGLSLFTGVSWLGVCERVGTWLEVGWERAWARAHEARDRQLGEEAAQRRALTVTEEKKIFEDHPPLHIEQPQTTIVKSERVKREKQRPLF